METVSYGAEATPPMVPTLGAEHGRAQLAPPRAVADVQAQHTDLSLHQPGGLVFKVRYGAPASHLAPCPRLEWPGACPWQLQQPHCWTQDSRAVQLQRDPELRFTPNHTSVFLPQFTHHDTGLFLASWKEISSSCQEDLLLLPSQGPAHQASPPQTRTLASPVAGKKCPSNQHLPCL